jgi:hypothetical protein
MFKRKARRSSRKMSYRAKARRSSSGSGLSLMNVALASAAYTLARPYVANLVPDFNVGPVSSDNLIIGAAGYYGMRKSGFIKALGTVALAGEIGVVAAKGVGQLSGGQGQQTDVYVYK